MNEITKEEMAHIQFRVPLTCAEEFNNLVFDRFGMKHGGKTQMFLLLIREYQKSQRIKQLHDEIAEVEKG